MNTVKISGYITDCKYDHTVIGEKFYSFYINSMRLSGTIDKIRCMVSDRAFNIDSIKKYEEDHLFVCIDGEYRSYRYRTKEEKGFKNHTNYFIFVKDMKMLLNDNCLPKFLNKDDFVNIIKLQGTVVKDPVYRQTPLGRDITDIIIRIDRSYNMNDYVPLIVWGKNAKYASAEIHKDDKIYIVGRIQSRLYTKVIEETGEVVAKMAYDISASGIEKIDCESPETTDTVTKSADNVPRNDFTIEITY